MLTNLFLSQTARVVDEALSSAGISEERTAVVGNPRLARALADLGRPVVTVGNKLRPLRRTGGAAVCGHDSRLPVGDEAVGAVVGLGAGGHEGWASTLEEWTRVVRDGGAVVLVDRQAPAELGRRALCGGLAEVQQRQAGRTTVTSGLVTHL